MMSIQETPTPIHQPLPSYRQILKYALRCYCPNCGKGKLYQSYLKPIAACPVCHEAYDHIRADDGPAWLTILIAGHIIVPLFVVLQAGATTPSWPAMIVCSALLIALVFGLLPFSKAFFVAMIWRSQLAEKS